MMRFALLGIAMVAGLTFSGCSGANRGAVAVIEKPISQRIADRTFPSVFQAWNPADNLKEGDVSTAARHDLLFQVESYFGLEWNHEYHGLATGFTEQSLERGRARRRELLSKNPNLILLMEVRYRDAWGEVSPPNPGLGIWQRRGFLPANHRWWKRDASGQIVKGWEEGGYFQLDFSNPEYREQVARQCEAAVRSGVVDGVMLDWWIDDPDRLALVKAIRQRIGEDAIVLVNANDHEIPLTARYINGLYMECFRTATPAEWNQIARTLDWAEKNLRQPRVNCVETWFHQSRDDAHLVRAVTTLSLVLSNGYCLFADPNPLPTPDHRHNWYPFWERSLGKAKGPGERRADGTIAREFEQGTAVYNPMGNRAVTVRFGETRISRATGRRALDHQLSGCDGDLYLKAEGQTPKQGDH